MKLNIKKIVLILIPALLLIFLLVKQSFSNDDYLHLFFLNVGQGDAEYIRNGNSYDVLIDGGPDKSVITELSDIMPFWDREINLVILSHPHADHVTGLIDVLKRYKVDEIVATDAVSTSSEYLEFLKLIKDKNIHFTLVQDINDIDLGNNIKLDFIYPKESFKDKKVDNLNNTSIVVKLIDDKFSALFTGDLEQDAQQNLISNLAIEPLDSARGRQFSNVNIWKVSHHGSKNGINDNFLKIINPDIAVIEVGEKNKYGHPAQPTMNKLTDTGAKIFRTDKNGRIEVTTDGQHFWLAPTRPK